MAVDPSNEMGLAPLPFTSSVVSDLLLNLPEPQFLHLLIGVVILTMIFKMKIK